jgi:hypothetical protein
VRPTRVVGLDGTEDGQDLPDVCHICPPLGAGGGGEMENR